MIEFVFMLTRHDRTVDDAVSVYAEIRGTGLRYIGFKDIGASAAQLREVCVSAQDDGLEVMLEVVSNSREDELRSVAAAAEIGVDWVLGGTHPQDGVRVLAGSKARYCPFPGRVVGHPSVLEGQIAEIAGSAREITALDGVFGLDLLAYRHETADVAELTRAVVQAASGPVIAAGSSGERGANQGARGRRGVGIHHRQRDLRRQAAGRSVDRRADPGGIAGRRARTGRPARLPGTAEGRRPGRVLRRGGRRPPPVKRPIRRQGGQCSRIFSVLLASVLSIAVAEYVPAGTSDFALVHPGVDFCRFQEMGSAVGMPRCKSVTSEPGSLAQSAEFQILAWPDLIISLMC